MNIVDVRPLHDTLGIPDAMLIAPGEPERSVLYQRISRRGRGQMPPLVSQHVDEHGEELIRTWIASLQPAYPIVQHWRMEDVVPFLSPEDQVRSVESGQKLYLRLECASPSFSAAGGWGRTGARRGYSSTDPHGVVAITARAITKNCTRVRCHYD